MSCTTNTCAAPQLDFTALLHLLVTSPALFTTAHAHQALAYLLQQPLPPAAQIGAFLTALKLHSLDTNPRILAACARALREHSVPVVFEGDAEWLRAAVVDVVGTGGDGHDTFNVSTTAAIVAAGAGCKMVKHGNRASSSASGSADLLESLGCRLTLPASSHAGILSRSGANFTFLFAQHHHPHLRHLAPLRRQLAFPTVFNLLGPLVNPACPMRMVVGVARKELGPVMLAALQENGVRRALVVCGHEGLDEISCAGETDVWELLLDGTVRAYTVSPESDFGLQRHPLADVSGGSPAENALMVEQLLAGKLPQGHPILDFVLLNAAAVLYVTDKVGKFRDAVELARESVMSGKALSELAQWKAETVRVYKEQIKSEEGV